MTTLGDAELVRAYVEKGQDTAFVEIMRRYQIPVFRQLSLDLADPDDAESACEALFVLASQRLGEWSHEEELKVWLSSLARDLSAKFRSSSIESDSPRLVDPAVYFRQHVHRALHELEPDQRQIIVAVDLDGQTAETLAIERGESVEQVTVALNQARARFTETLSRPAGRNDEDRAERPRNTPSVSPGEIIDNRYRVEEVLGEGGMATVFEAQHLGIKRRVALKTLRPTRQMQDMIRERFEREAEVLGRLAHPNFVDVSDFGESSEGVAYLVMELLQGRPLSEELRAAGSMPPLRALRIVREISGGLSFAHELGIIHRDIKPDNIVILDSEPAPGFAKILDLGIATTSDESGEDNVLYGTPGYMAPEQIEGGRIDARIDIYAVGITLFELLTGAPPFQGASIQFLLVQQLTSPVPSLRDVGVELDHHAAIQRLIDGCTAKNRRDRFKTAQVLLDEIDQVLALFDDAGDTPAERRIRESSAVTSTRTVRESSPSRAPLRWWIWVLVVVGLTALGWMIYRA